MNQITLLVLLIVTSLFLPASVIMYASGSPQNSDESDSGSMDGDDASDDGSMDDASDDGSMDDASDDGSMDDASDSWSMEKSNNALDSWSMENDEESDSGSMDSDDMSDSWSMEKSNNALTPGPTGTNDGFAPSTPPPSTPRPTGTNDGLTPLTPGPTGTPTAVDGTPTQTPTEGPSTPPTLTPGANAQQTFRIEDTTGNATGNVRGNGIADTILPIMNQERALVGVPPLTWNNTLAADAQAWADRLVATGNVVHCFQVPGSQQFEECTHNESENLFNTNDPPGSAPDTPSNIAKAAFDWWFSEKSGYNAQTNTCTPVPPLFTCSHYTQMVWKSTTQIGCASANDSSKGLTVVSCRFSPPGNIIGQTPY